MPAIRPQFNGAAPVVQSQRVTALQKPATVLTPGGFQPSGSVRDENAPSQASVGQARRMNANRRDLNAAAHSRVPITMLPGQKLQDRFSGIQGQLTKGPDLSHFDRARSAQEQSFESQRIRQNQETSGAITRRLTALGQQNSGAGLGLLAKAQGDINDQINEQKNSAMANLDFQRAQAGLQGDEQTKDRLFNIAQSGSQRDLQQAGLDLQVAAANGDSKAKADLVKFEKLAKLREFDIAEKTGQLQQEADLFNKRMAERASSSQDMGNVLGAIGAGAGIWAASDEKLKKNIEDDDGEVQEFLDSLESKKFDYLEPKKEGRAEGKRFGVMAQDLEKSDMGKSLVKETKEGKMVDTAQGTMSTMSALGQINRRLKKIEEGMKG